MNNKKVVLLFDPAPSSLVVDEVNGYIDAGFEVYVNVHSREVENAQAKLIEGVLLCDIPLNPSSLKAFLAQNKVDVLKMRRNVAIDASFIKELSDAGNMPAIIAQAGAGLDHIDMVEAKQQGIHVLNTPGINADAVAEYTIGQIITFHRNCFQHNLEMHNGKFTKSSSTLYPQLNQLTLGIVGVGSIGKLLIKYANAFGMNVIGYCRNIEKVADSTKYEATNSLDYLLSHSDVISINLPKTSETLGFISSFELSKMKHGALLVNTSRGGVVVEADLKAALEKGLLSGAIIDVFDKQAPPKPKLLSGPGTPKCDLPSLLSYVAILTIES